MRSVSQTPLGLVAMADVKLCNVVMQSLLVAMLTGVFYATREHAVQALNRVGVTVACHIVRA